MKILNTLGSILVTFLLVVLPLVMTTLSDENLLLAVVCLGLLMGTMGVNVVRWITK